MLEKILILLCEDVDADRRLLQNEIKRANIDAEYICVENEEDFRKHLLQSRPDIVLSDYSLPSFNGMQALKITRMHAPILPFILVTGSLNEETAVEVMKAGADDYILKDNLKKIGPAIEHAIERKNDREEKIQATENLRISEARYRALIETSPNGITLMDLQGKIIFCNRQNAWLHGYDSPEDITGLLGTDMVSSADIKRMSEDLKFLLLVGSITNVEYKGRKRNGELFPLEYSATVIYDEQGKPFGIMSVSSDITERKRYESEIIRAKEKAEESDRLKTSLLANMSHELRTPMNGILGFAQILKEELKDTSQLKIANKIYMSGKRLMSTIGSVLDLSELEANKLRVKKEAVRLLPVIRSISTAFSEEKEYKDIELEIVSHDDNITALADEILFTQVLKNLIDNAFKFTDEGKIQISLSEEIKDEKSGSQALIRISDTGIGISEENLKIVFEPFRQGSEGTSRSHEGTGLGLTIAKKMTELMNGHIAIESAPGRGTTVILTFPSVTAQQQDRTDLDAPGRKRTAEAVQKETLPEILLVEDNFLNKDVTVLYLKNICRVEHASSGKKAIEMASKKHYSLILMDINLGPGIDGVEAFRQIRQFENYGSVPAVALTGYAMRGDRERLLSEGFTHYLAKPFEKYELVELMKSLLVINI